jgi:hypothetical protein
MLLWLSFCIPEVFITVLDCDRQISFKCICNPLVLCGIFLEILQEVGVLHRVLTPLLLEQDVRSIFT